MIALFLQHFRFYLQSAVAHACAHKSTVIRGRIWEHVSADCCHANCREAEMCELRSVVSVCGGISTRIRS